MVPVDLDLHGIPEGGKAHDPQWDTRDKAHLAETLKHCTIPETTQHAGLFA